MKLKSLAYNPLIFMKLGNSVSKVHMIIYRRHIILCSITRVLMGNLMLSFVVGFSETRTKIGGSRDFYS